MSLFLSLITGYIHCKVLDNIKLVQHSLVLIYNVHVLSEPICERFFILLGGTKAPRKRDFIAYNKIGEFLKFQIHTSGSMQTSGSNQDLVRTQTIIENELKLLPLYTDPKYSSWRSLKLLPLCTGPKYSSCRSLKLLPLYTDPKYSSCRSLKLLALNTGPKYSSCRSLKLLPLYTDPKYSSCRSLKLLPLNTGDYNCDIT